MLPSLSTCTLKQPINKSVVYCLCPKIFCIPQQSSAYVYSILIHIAWGEIETKPFWENYPLSYPRSRCLQGPFFCLHLHCQEENWSEKGQLADSIAKSLLCNIQQQHWRTFVHILFTCFLSNKLISFQAGQILTIWIGRSGRPLSINIWRPGN